MTQKRTEIVRRPQHRPGFFWRGLLIVLPVVVLAAFGVLSLRQDRKLIESEVRERARAFVKEAAERCGKRLTSLPTDLAYPTRDTGILPRERTFRVSAQGELVIPPAYSAVPVARPVDPSRLNPEQVDLWQRFGSAAAVNSPTPSMIADLRKFLEINPDNEFVALAHFRLAMLLRKADPKQAAEQFSLVIDQFPNSVGETGLSLGLLARIKLAEMSLEASEPSEIRATLEQLCSSAVARPSLLTPLILDQAAEWEQQYLGSDHLAAHWTKLWDRDEENRRAFQSAQRSLFPAAIENPGRKVRGYIAIVLVGLAGAT